MKTVHIAGLGQVSRHVAAQIEICDEAGAEQVVLPVPIVRALQPLGYTEKEVRQAIFTLHRAGTLEKIAPGQYKWAQPGAPA